MADSTFPADNSQMADHFAGVYEAAAERHILSSPVWDALSTRQSKFAAGGDLARRFSPDIGPLASARDDTSESLSALAELVAADGNIILLQSDPIKVPLGTIAVKTAFGVQMVLDRLVPSNSEIENRIEPLEDKDVTEMVTLAKLTTLGPFKTGTPRLSQFWGIKEKGRLAAMAGERMKHVGYSEISGVCSHPDFRGHGFARALSAALTKKNRREAKSPTSTPTPKILRPSVFMNHLGFKSDARCMPPFSRACNPGNLRPCRPEVPTRRDNTPICDRHAFANSSSPVRYGKAMRRRPLRPPG